LTCLILARMFIDSPDVSAKEVWAGEHRGA
jgi:hypothetical protein